MSRFSGAMPAGSAKARPATGATMSDDQMRRAVERGEVKLADLSIAQREIYREELKKGSLRAGTLTR